MIWSRWSPTATDDAGGYSPDECAGGRETVVVSVEQQGVTIRRVGFRSGTDAELRMLHAVEAPVEAERRPDREPQPVGSYIAFARRLPSQFDDHTWVAQDADGTPVASAACWSNAAGDPRVMECDVFVRRDRRRERLGSRLLEQICETTLEEGRTILVWPTFAAVPAGEALARSVGARVARVNRTSELRLAGVDWAMVEGWIESAAGRGLGYTLDLVDGPYPEALRSDGARFHHIMQTAPRDDLDVGDVAITEHDVAELDAALVEAGRKRTILVRDPNGRCVGGTEVTFEPWEPATALQQNTGIDPVHRGLGLAKWCKAAMLQRIRLERPAVERVRTGNAFSNAPMLAINDALGFEVISTLTEWQAEAAVVRRLLTGR
jgi:GNAT superfamily N-acetyltransferase